MCKTRYQLHKYYFLRTPTLIIFNLSHFSKSLTKINITYSFFQNFQSLNVSESLNLFRATLNFFFQFCTSSRMCSLYTFFSVLYEFQNVLIVHFLFQLCTCSRMCLLYLYIIHMSRNSILSLFYAS